jgi:multidrug efflux pump subunit AcrB
LNDVFGTLQAFLGSAYVNDFNKFGRTYQVKVQAAPQFRVQAEDINQLEVRSNTNSKCAATVAYGTHRHPGQC